MFWSSVSKIVGWEDRKIDYPTESRVEYLYLEMQKSNIRAMIELLTYHRFCKATSNPEQNKIMDRVTELVMRGRELLEKGLY